MQQTPQMESIMFTFYCMKVEEFSIHVRQCEETCDFFSAILTRLWQFKRFPNECRLDEYAPDTHSA